MQATVALLEPIYDAQLVSIRASGVKAMDEVPIKAGRSRPEQDENHVFLAHLRRARRDLLHALAGTTPKQPIVSYCAKVTVDVSSRLPYLESILMDRINSQLELAACNPAPVDIANFNPRAVIPYGVTVGHICAAMNDFVSFISMIDVRLNQASMTRFESFLMPANFSSIVGEFMSATIPKHSRGIVKNNYHNGHPDMLPAGRYPNDSIQYCHDGIEIKGSRYLKGWQGHNPEDVWLMVFMFDSNRPVDISDGVPPRPFKFLRVVGAQLTKEDWRHSGRSETSRRTITASVTESGYQKLMANWIYNAPGLRL